MLLYPHHRALAAPGSLGLHRIAVPSGARLEVATVDISASRRDCTAALGNLLRPLCPAMTASAA
ncbi:hypothetical protein GON01_07135 [Sphingomonas sp. MAH-20]|uniref:Uncharacterized protein n=1 Tax=Sphingomonas horti TaxID=2682842 RepID=A0A6I4J0N3_9SPHN|nr:hypothetical protein [Sphingomonas horti]MVO77708.1 hypothetical protein [Sphingomonas horti]